MGNASMNRGGYSRYMQTGANSNGSELYMSAPPYMADIVGHKFWSPRGGGCSYQGTTTAGGATNPHHYYQPQHHGPPSHPPPQTYYPYTQPQAVQQ